ncbi:MAG: tRNA (N6-threonylcarbamoyladenosine(37)-N6)-methyltransferase TrmO [Gammaproteobacteria bacterium]
MSTDSKPSSVLQYRPIGFVSSPFKQKFAIPRQPNLVREAKGQVILEKEFASRDSLREIETFSHIWLLFHFHATAEQGWTPTVQPPRLGGKTRVGVFASRSPFRPNAIGMSVVELLDIGEKEGQLVINVAGIDLLDGTPILDIKPYLPYADSIEDAAGGFAESPPGSEMAVQFSVEAERSLDSLEADYSELRQFITSILRQDPRPAWRVKEQDEKRYGMSLFDLNIKWELTQEAITVISINKETVS